MPRSAEAAEILTRWSGSGVLNAFGREVVTKSLSDTVARSFVIYVERITIEWRYLRLAGSALIQSDDLITLIRMVLQGSRAVATDTRPTGPAMPSFDWRLNDAQVAAVLTYLRNSWGNAAAAVPAGDVTKQRSSETKPTLGQN